jgi:hypothetical protein
MSHRPARPTARQLRYLRALAECTGTTFASPGTREEGGREIRPLQALPSLTEVERRHERRILEGDHQRLQPSTAVKPQEISGQGSHATWAERC